MDIFAHTLWANALFHLKYHNQRKWRYVAAFFGVVPDFIGFTPLFVYLILSGRFFGNDRFPFSDTSNWTFGFAENAYNYTHSLVIFVATLLAVTIIGNIYKYYKSSTSAGIPNRNFEIGWFALGKFKIWFFWPLLGWALHILIDLPTHPDFYQTPIFFPLSDFRNSHGVSWGHPIFMAVNYTLLISVYAGLWYYQRKKYAPKV